jgi:hypothetical protein
VPSRPFAARIRAELQLKQTDSWAEHTHNITIEVVERPRAKGFVLLPAAGSSNAPSPGSPDAAAAPATTNASPNTTKPSSTSPQPST